MPRKLTREEFIQKAKEAHGEKYDYSLFEYKGNDVKSTIICPKHGQFQQSPHVHGAGSGCQKCRTDLMKSILSMSQEEFIERSTKAHGGKYDYSKVEYVNCKTKACIICPVHGEFWQVPGDHINGCGCDACSGTMKLDTPTFINRAKELHGDRYDYSKVVYELSSIPVPIICKKHGIFMQAPNSHLNGQGCRQCGIEESKSLRYGVGINDYDGLIKINGKHLKSYEMWGGILDRCYNEEDRVKNPTYGDCEISEEWKKYTSFKAFFDNPENGYTDGYAIDKDLISHGNRLYTAEYCCFVPQEINNLILRQDKHRGECLIGVHKPKDSNKYIAQMSKIGKISKHIGSYNTELEAFNAYKKSKEDYLKEMADQYYSEGKITKRVHDALYKYEVLTTD